MPNSINYSKLQRTLPPPRIQTYRNLFANHSDKEIYGVYLWNKSLCGAVYPLLQAVEIALRNAIDKVARDKYGDHWHTKIPHYKHKNPQGKLEKNENYKDLVDRFRSASRSVIRAQEKRGFKAPQGYVPNHDKVVAETPFSVWECALHKCFYNTSDKSFLWPHESKKAFNNWPFQSAKKTHTRIYDLISELRPFRNRLSHHEPLWKGINVASEDDALTFVNKKINAIEELLNIVCDENLKYIHSQDLFGSARRVCSKACLDQFRYRTKMKQFSLKSKRKARAFLYDIHRRDKSVIFTHGGRRFLISKA